MKIKFNWMDTVILLVLIAVVALGGFFLTNKGQEERKNMDKEVNIMVELSSKEENFKDIIHEGDVVMVGVKEKTEMTVTKVEVTPSKTLGYDTMEGKVANTTIPDRYDIKIYLTGDGTESDKAVEVNETPVRVGMGISLKHKNWIGYGYILTVDTAEK